MAYDEGKTRDQLRHYEILWTQAANARTVWQDIVDYEFPSHRDIERIAAPNEKKNRFIFDSTAVDGIFTSSSFVQGTIFNQASRWFGLRHPEAELNEKASVSGYLSKRRNAQLMRYKQSNFYAGSFELVQDWIGFGNGAMLIEPTKPKYGRPANLVFTTFPVGSFVWNEGDEGWINKIWRCTQWKGIQLYERWKDKLPQKLKEKVDKKPFDDVEILHGIFPRDVFSTYRSRQRSDRKPFASVWIWKDGKETIEESGYDEWPVACVRWAVTSGEPYARGLGELALPDAQTLNVLKKKIFIAMDKTVDPATLEKKGNIVSGILDHRPGARNVVNDINGIRILDAELRAGNRFQEINMADLQRSIRQTFFVDDIKRLISAEGPNPQKTAFEVAQRLKLLYQILGPVSGRFESEGQKTNINRTGALLDRIGTFVPPPPELAGDKRFDIEYDSPLSRAQRDDEALAIQQYVGSDIPLLMQVDPTVKNIPDAHMMARHLAEIRNVQHELRDQDDVDKITDLENQVLSMQQALAAAGQTAEAVGKLGPVLPYVNGGQQGAPQ